MITKERVEKLQEKAYREVVKGEASLFVFACGNVLLIKSIDKFMMYGSVSEYVRLAKQEKAPLVKIENTVYFDHCTLEDYAEKLEEITL